MTESHPPDHPGDKRAEKREETDRRCSAIIRISGAPDYQVKLKDISENSACFIVNNDSSLLSHVKVGDRVDIQLHLADGANASAYYKSKIIHITKAVSGRFNSHFMIGIRMQQRLSLV